MSLQILERKIGLNISLFNLKANNHWLLFLTPKIEIGFCEAISKSYLETQQQQQQETQKRVKWVFMKIYPPFGFNSDPSMFTFINFL